MCVCACACAIVTAQDPCVHKALVLALRAPPFGVDVMSDTYPRARCSKLAWQVRRPIVEVLIVFRSIQMASRRAVQTMIAARYEQDPGRLGLFFPAMRKALLAHVRANKARPDKSLSADKW